MIWVDGTVDGTEDNSMTTGLVNVAGMVKVDGTGDGVGTETIYLVGTLDGTNSSGMMTLFDEIIKTQTEFGA